MDNYQQTVNFFNEDAFEPIYKRSRSIKNNEKQRILSRGKSSTQKKKRSRSRSTLYKRSRSTKRSQSNNNVVQSDEQIIEEIQKFRNDIFYNPLLISLDSYLSEFNEIKLFARSGNSEEEKISDVYLDGIGNGKQSVTYICKSIKTLEYSDMYKISMYYNMAMSFFLPILQHNDSTYKGIQNPLAKNEKENEKEYDKDGELIDKEYEEFKKITEIKNEKKEYIERKEHSKEFANFKDKEEYDAMTKKINDIEKELKNREKTFETEEKLTALYNKFDTPQLVRMFFENPDKILVTKQKEGPWRFYRPTYDEFQSEYLQNAIPTNMVELQNKLSRASRDAIDEFRTKYIFSPDVKGEEYKKNKVNDFLRTIFTPINAILANVPFVSGGIEKITNSILPPSASMPDMRTPPVIKNLVKDKENSILKTILACFSGLTYNFFYMNVVMFLGPRFVMTFFGALMKELKTIFDEITKSPEISHSNYNKRKGTRTRTRTNSNVNRRHSTKSLNDRSYLKSKTRKYYSKSRSQSNLQNKQTLKNTKYSNRKISRFASNLDINHKHGGLELGLSSFSYFIRWGIYNFKWLFFGGLVQLPLTLLSLFKATPMYSTLLITTIQPFIFETAKDTLALPVLKKILPTNVYNACIESGIMCVNSRLMLIPLDENKFTIYSDGRKTSKKLYLFVKNKTFNTSLNDTKVISESRVIWFDNDDNFYEKHYEDFFYYVSFEKDSDNYNKSIDEHIKKFSYEDNISSYTSFRINFLPNLYIVSSLDSGLRIISRPRLTKRFHYRGFIKDWKDAGNIKNIFISGLGQGYEITQKWGTPFFGNFDHLCMPAIKYMLHLPLKMLNNICSLINRANELLASSLATFVGKSIKKIALYVWNGGEDSEINKLNKNLNNDIKEEEEIIKENTKKEEIKHQMNKRRSSSHSGKDNAVNSTTFNSMWFSTLTIVPLDGERFTNRHDGDKPDKPLFILSKVVFNNKYYIPKMNYVGKNGFIQKDVRIVNFNIPMETPDDFKSFLKKFQFHNIQKKIILRLTNNDKTKLKEKTDREKFERQDFSTSLLDHINNYNDVYSVKNENLPIEDISIRNLFVRKGRRVSSVLNKNA